MKIEIKKVLTLIRSHYDKNEKWFKETCLEIEKECDSEIGAYILAQTDSTNTFEPGGGEVTPDNKDLLKKIKSKIKSKERHIRRIEEEYMKFDLVADKKSLNIEQIAVLGIEIRLLKLLVNEGEK
jgi:hypothetical protein